MATTITGNRPNASTLNPASNVNGNPIAPEASSPFPEAQLPPGSTHDANKAAEFAGSKKQSTSYSGGSNTTQQYTQAQSGQQTNAPTGQTMTAGMLAGSQGAVNSLCDTNNVTNDIHDANDALADESLAYLLANSEDMETSVDADGTVGWGSHEGNSQTKENMLNGRKKALPMKDNDKPTNKVESASGADIQLEQGPVQGWAQDTVQGDRINKKHSHNTNDFTGGGYGQEEDTCGKIGAAGGLAAGVAAMMGHPEASLVIGIATGAASLVCEFLPDSKKETSSGPPRQQTDGGTPPGEITDAGGTPAGGVPGNDGAKDPNPNADPSSGGGTIVVGKGETVGGAVRDALKPQGTAGSSDDGRGTDNVTGGPYSKYSDQAIATHTGAAGGREVEPNSSAVSLEQAFKQATFTDPTRK